MNFQLREPRPRVEVGWAAGRRHVFFFVIDNGSGVPLRYQQRIFGGVRRRGPRQHVCFTLPPADQAASEAPGA